MHVVFLCYIFVLYEIILACIVFMLYAVCLKKKDRETKNDVLYFPVCGMRSDILCHIFSARGTRSGIIVLYFMRIEGTLALLCCIFCAWIAI